MENINKAEEILKKVLQFDDNTLIRVKFSKALYKLLKDTKLPKTLKEDILSFDGLSPAKKRAFAKYTLININQLKKHITSTKEEKEVFNDKIQISQLSKIYIKNSKLLKPIEKRAFKKVGVQSIKDALYYFPIRYEDKRIKTIKQVNDGESGVFEVQVIEIKKVNKGKIKVQVVLKDDTGYITANFVHDKPFLFNIFKKDKNLLIAGKVNVFRKEKSIFQPEIYDIEDSIVINKIVPVYSLRGDANIKITSQTINHLRRGIFKLLKRYHKYIDEYMPEEILNKYKLPHISQSIRNIHFPDNSENIDSLNDFETRFQKRFIFEELFLLQLAQSYKKHLIKQNKAPAIEVKEDFIQNFENTLPFNLTNTQKKAIQDILEDIKKPIPMNRMVQGDVGSGKTLVAIAVSLAVAQNKKQVAVMAPTEILAKQHFLNFEKILKPFNIKVGLLTGSLSQKEKKQLQKAIKEGYLDIIIGTHSLIQEEVEYKDLSLVIVDEQHRFGVKQRKALSEKSKNSPHILVMTATPIPRTLTMAIYGDLDVSIINELPKGRKPVETILLFDDERKYLYKKINDQLEQGRQAFVVYPLIESSEKMDLKSAEEGFKHWKEAFPDKKVVMLHGKMPQEEKDKIMEDFKNKKAHILISTTVIEVGVDIPNASIMVIEEAHRFGLSQIHQLRGRIGRGEYNGYCFLVVPKHLRKPSDDPSKENKRLQTLYRLKVLVKTSDGFKIAEEDLKLRGTGDLVGTAQSGKFNFSIADLERPIDINILKYAKQEAENLINKDPLLENHQQLKQLLFEKYGDRFELAQIA